MLKKHLGTTLHGGERPRGMRLNFKKGQDLPYLAKTSWLRETSIQGSHSCQEYGNFNSL